MERGIFCTNFIDCFGNQKLEWSVEQCGAVRLVQIKESDRVKTIPWENFRERLEIF